MKLVHDSKRVIDLVPDETKVRTQQTVFTGTKEECEAEIERLKLQPLKGRNHPAPLPTRD